MKKIWIISCFTFFAGCSSNRIELKQGGEASFRISLNYLRELSDREVDSIERSYPDYIYSPRENSFYDLLVRKGFVREKQLDTTGLNLSLLTWEKPSVSYQQTVIEIETSGEKDYLIVKKDGAVAKADLGQGLLGDRFVSLIDIDDDKKLDILLLDKYYIMVGYNFDLKVFHLVK